MWTWIEKDNMIKYNTSCKVFPVVCILSLNGLTRVVFVFAKLVHTVSSAKAYLQSIGIELYMHMSVVSTSLAKWIIFFTDLVLHIFCSKGKKLAGVALPYFKMLN